MTVIDTTAVATTTFTVPAGLAVTHFANVAMFTSKDRERPVLTCVEVEVMAGLVTLTATDSYALIRETLEAEVDGPDGKWLIPGSLLVEASKACKKADGDIGVHLGADVVTVTVGGTTLTAQVMDAAYPNYGQLIPTGEPVALAGIGLRADLLARVTKLRDADRPREADVALRFEFHGERKPCIVRLGKATFVLQMPAFPTA